jgi:prepilin-type N-terminal cleavage/methylation domain-containing protein
MRAVKYGFTLIELLIVVAIIAILAAIAVPNFLEAQTRSKISRVRADFRTIATGLESYYVDYNWYPLNYHNNPNFWTPPQSALANTSIYWADSSGALRANASFVLAQLSSPVAYLASSRFIDPFRPSLPVTATTNTGSDTFWFAASPKSSPLYWRQVQGSRWSIQSWGPNRLEDWLPDPDPTHVVPGYSNPFHFMPYDPTNGTVSKGDLLRYGPGGEDK